MLVMMLLALFAWLLPQEAWAEDYVGNRSKYKVWIEGMNVIKAELPCYDQSGSDTWQTDGWLYYHIDGQAQSTRVAVINCNPSGGHQLVGQRDQHFQQSHLCLRQNGKCVPGKSDTGQAHRKENGNHAWTMDRIHLSRRGYRTHGGPHRVDSAA